MNLHKEISQNHSTSVLEIADLELYWKEIIALPPPRNSGLSGLHLNPTVCVALLQHCGDITGKLNVRELTSLNVVNANFREHLIKMLSVDATHGKLIKCIKSGSCAPIVPNDSGEPSF